MPAYHEDTTPSLAPAPRQTAGQSWNTADTGTATTHCMHAFVFGTLLCCSDRVATAANWVPFEIQPQIPAFGCRRSPLSLWPMLNASPPLGSLNLFTRSTAAYKHRPAYSPYSDALSPLHLHTFPSAIALWRRRPQVSCTPRQPRPDDILRAVKP